MAAKLANKTKVSIVSAVSLLGLVVTLKNILQIPAEILSRDVVLFIIIYSAFSILYPEKILETKTSALDKPLYWSLLIILVTVGIVVSYAL